MSDPAPDTKAPAEPQDEEAKIAGRWIAVTLAAIALLGAAIGILQTYASVNEANTARETTRTAVGSLRAAVIDGQARALETDIGAEQGAFFRQRAFLVRQAEAQGASAPPLDSEQLQSLIGPGGDLPSARTAEGIRRLSFEAEQLALQQAALAETRVTWNDRSTQYTTTITVLAVALFLVGFSSVLRGQRQLAFYLLGVAVALGTLAVVIYIYVLPIPATPSEAITATARGTVAGDEGRFDEALAALGDAIEIDDDYAAPYSRRALVRALSENPDVSTTGAITSGPEPLRDAVADARRALELGGDRDFLAIGLIAILSLYAADYDQAIDAADEAIAVNGSIPDIRLLKSAAQIGAGDVDGARGTLDEALALLSGSDPTARTRGLVAEYVTYLEAVAAAEPARADVVAELEAEIISRETAFNLDREVSGTAPPSGSASVEGLRYEDGRLRLRLEWADLPADTALTAIGFERAQPDGPWVQPSEVAEFVNLTGDGTDVVNEPLERACTPTEVRVDLYLDGGLVESVTGPGEAPTC